MAFGWGWLKGKFGRDTHSCPECQAEMAAQTTYCDVCGYDLVRKTRDDISGDARPDLSPGTTQPGYDSDVVPVAVDPFRVTLEQRRHRLGPPLVLPGLSANAL